VICRAECAATGGSSRAQNRQGSVWRVEPQTRTYASYARRSVGWLALLQLSPPALGRARVSRLPQARSASHPSPRVLRPTCAASRRRRTPPAPRRDPSPRPRRHDRPTQRGRRAPACRVALSARTSSRRSTRQPITAQGRCQRKQRLTTCFDSKSQRRNGAAARRPDQGVLMRPQPGYATESNVLAGHETLAPHSSPNGSRRG
jgi:hypothetical protein